MQVLHNLKSNALKYTSRGGITFGVGVLQLIILTPREGTEHEETKSETTQQFLLSVKDTGVGIKRDSQQSLFKMFGKLEENARMN